VALAASARQQVLWVRDLFGKLTIKAAGDLVSAVERV
jgi:hypothetical protein